MPKTGTETQARPWGWWKPQERPYNFAVESRVLDEITREGNMKTHPVAPTDRGFVVLHGDGQPFTADELAELPDDLRPNLDYGSGAFHWSARWKADRAAAYLTAQR